MNGFLSCSRTRQGDAGPSGAAQQAQQEPQQGPQPRRSSRTTRPTERVRLAQQAEIDQAAAAARQEVLRAEAEAEAAIRYNPKLSFTLPLPITNQDTGGRG
jgi:hypothetical protein